MPDTTFYVPVTTRGGSAMAIVCAAPTARKARLRVASERKHLNDQKVHPALGTKPTGHQLSYYAEIKAHPSISSSR